MVRATGLVRETAKITLANLAYNTRRLVWVDGRTAPA
jgi:IS5 family transposase